MYLLLFSRFFAKKSISERLRGRRMPKIYFSRLQKFFEKFRKKFLKNFTLGPPNGPLKIAPNVKKSRFQGAEKAKNRSRPKKSIFSKSEISITYHPSKFEGGGEQQIRSSAIVGEKLHFFRFYTSTDNPKYSIFY